MDLSNAQILDVGAGGGFPGIPLAILFPSADFIMMDSIRKKVLAMDAIKDELGLGNVQCIHRRVEESEVNVDFVTGRAVTALPRFYQWVSNRVRWERGEGKSGILYLKGGDFYEELGSIPKKQKVWSISEIIADPFFETKKLIYLYE
jgi:16S rRNA (guanine527-N7)-methyltransferase